MDKPTNPTDEGAGATERDVSPERSTLREYELFLAQGLGENDSLSDWLAKERQLRDRLRLRTRVTSGSQPPRGDGP